MTTEAEQTLTEALRAIGVHHEEATHRHDYGDRDLFAGNAYLGAYDCRTAWAIVHRAQSAA